MPPKVSVVTPSYNGAEKIPVLMRALRAQTHQDFEWIIVIDGSVDNTHAVINMLETSFQKSIIVQSNQGRAITKNNGVKNAQGDLLIFFDDDMSPEKECIANHIKFHATHQGLLAGNIGEFVDSQKTDIQNYKADLTKKWTEKYSDGINKLNSSNLFFTAANCSMRRDVFDSLNGFDERLTDAEDHDLAVRALEKNIPVYFDKSNIAIHHDSITCKSYIQRTRQYQKAQIKLKELNPERLNSHLRKIPFPKLFFYWLFSFSFWPKLIDETSLIGLLPKFFRYKIYDWVVYSLGVVFPSKKI
jgi:glycosyltransferase involved in cell wall biosynthesis